MIVNQKIERMLQESPNRKQLEKMLRLYQPLLLKIEKIIAEKSQLIIGIDGHCTSGKTTLAELIHSFFESNIFHMDDFYKSHTQSNSSLEHASNIDFERLQTVVLIPLVNNQNIDYQAFDCKTQLLQPIIQKSSKSISIIEGSYAMHPQISHIYDLKIFLKSSYIQQIRRVYRRNGYKELKMFIIKWIPNERKYIKHFHIEKLSNYVFKSLH